jgi:hypothetical protein
MLDRAKILTLGMLFFQYTAHGSSLKEEKKFVYQSDKKSDVSSFE